MAEPYCAVVKSAGKGGGCAPQLWPYLLSLLISCVHTLFEAATRCLHRLSCWKFWVKWVSEDLGCSSLLAEWHLSVGNGRDTWGLWGLHLYWEDAEDSSHGPAIYGPVINVPSTVWLCLFLLLRRLPLPVLFIFSPQKICSSLYSLLSSRN